MIWMKRRFHQGLKEMASEWVQREQSCLPLSWKRGLRSAEVVGRSCLLALSVGLVSSLAKALSDVLTLAANFVQALGQQ